MDLIDDEVSGCGEIFLSHSSFPSFEVQDCFFQQKQDKLPVSIGSTHEPIQGLELCEERHEDEGWSTTRRGDDDEDLAALFSPTALIYPSFLQAQKQRCVLD